MSTRPKPDPQNVIVHPNTPGVVMLRGPKNGAGESRPEAFPEPLDFINPATAWAVGNPPARRWVIRDWIPAGDVTLLSGDGGIGKSLLAQQLATCVVTGRPCLGLPVTQCRDAIALSSEDDADELWRRQVSINEHMGIGMNDLTGLHFIARPCADNVLQTHMADGEVQATELFDSLADLALRSWPGVVVIDAAADVFGGNEIVRTQVRIFITMLRLLAQASGAAVVLVSHPSLSGLASGSGISGSTAWNNSVRSRLYLARPAPEDGVQANDSIRILSKKKSNYARAGEEIRLRWSNGVLIPDPTFGGIVGAIAGRNADGAFMACLDELARQGRDASPSPSSANFAPKLMVGMAAGQGFRRADFRAAMERLLHASLIAVERYGRPSDRRTRLAPSAVPPGNKGSEGGEVA